MQAKVKKELLDECNRLRKTRDSLIAEVDSASHDNFATLRASIEANTGHLDIAMKAVANLFTFSIAGFLTTLGLVDMHISNLFIIQALLVFLALASVTLTAVLYFKRRKFVDLTCETDSIRIEMRNKFLGRQRDVITKDLDKLEKRVDDQLSKGA
jgi:hypothetical protein